MRRALTNTYRMSQSNNAAVGRFLFPCDSRFSLINEPVKMLSRSIKKLNKSVWRSYFLSWRKRQECESQKSSFRFCCRYILFHGTVCTVLNASSYWYGTVPGTYSIYVANNWPVLICEARYADPELSPSEYVDELWNTENGFPSVCIIDNRWLCVDTEIFLTHPDPTITDPWRIIN